MDVMFRYGLIVAALTAFWLNVPLVIGTAAGAEPTPGAVPAVEVLPRDDALPFYPCETCHGMLPLNPEQRVLFAPHAVSLDHGSDSFWCMDCHAAEDRNALQSAAGEAVSFDESYRVCGQCHEQPQQDWLLGAHGEPAGGPQGDRQLYNCTHCHDPHAPAAAPH